MSTDVTIAAAKRALAAAGEHVPELAALARTVKISVSPKLSTAGIFRSGRMVLNPEWFGLLDPADQEFVVAHELLHLLLRTHDRAEGSPAGAFNLAHDAVINDLLFRRLGRTPPASGVWLPGAAALAAEELLNRPPGEPSHDCLRDDALDDELERELFGHEPSLAERGWGEARIVMENELVEPDMADKLVSRLGWLPAPDMEPDAKRVALGGLQRWLAGVAGHERRRSYARPSRKLASESCVRPGRASRPAKLGVVVDTSSSMVGRLASARLVLQWLERRYPLRVVLSDGVACATVTHLPRARDWVAGSAGDREVVVMPSPCERCGIRHAYRVAGVQTDLSQGVERLGRDASVDAIVVLSDGYAKATRPPPRPLLWALLGQEPGTAPRMGSTVHLASLGAE